MATPDSLFDEMTAIFDASGIVGRQCKEVNTQDGLDWMVRIHSHLRQRHQDLRYLDSFERDVAIERIKLEYE